jgi:hypothetical protein
LRKYKHYAAIYQAVAGDEAVAGDALGVHAEICSAMSYKFRRAELEWASPAILAVRGGEGAPATGAARAREINPSGWAAGASVE